MNTKYLKSNTGFTLIELLIVIGIIAFLASIVVATLADSREGARNSQRNETARQYVSAINLYQTEYGVFPGADSTQTTYRCIGDGYPSNQCRVFGIHSENTQLNDQIDEFIPIPASLESFAYSGNDYFGIVYRCTNTDCTGYQLTWMLEGEGNDANCFGGAAAADVGGVFKHCTFSGGETS